MHVLSVSFVVYGLAGSATVLPEAAERRAASRISETTMLVSKDDGPAGFMPSTTTARK